MIFIVSKYVSLLQSVRCNVGYIRKVVGRGAGEAIAPIIWDFAPIHYLLNNKIPIYCLPLQYQFSDYLPDSDKWTIGQLDKCPITKRTAHSSICCCCKAILNRIAISAGKSVSCINLHKTLYKSNLAWLSAIHVLCAWRYTSGSATAARSTQ